MKIELSSELVSKLRELASSLWDEDERQELIENLSMDGNGDDCFYSGERQGMALIASKILSFIE